MGGIPMRRSIRAINCRSRCGSLSGRRGSPSGSRGRTNARAGGGRAGSGRAGSGRAGSGRAGSGRAGGGHGVRRDRFRGCVVCCRGGRNALRGRGRVAGRGDRNAGLGRGAMLGRCFPRRVLVAHNVSSGDRIMAIGSWGWIPRAGSLSWIPRAGSLELDPCHWILGLGSDAPSLPTVNKGSHRRSL
ncbi:hypothetical protein Ahu01nite_064840 [Winogradskya humida]|uniref:Uncharacterized protein n=1 Tax=Winogradskya humida TaxID=113566 RepID=A0ABQ3ZXY7_9ACTN|nr:hypothetical protein Ahu01nite_064840 [Actinoplanes humidus]